MSLIKNEILTSFVLFLLITSLIIPNISGHNSKNNFESKVIELYNTKNNVMSKDSWVEFCKLNLTEGKLSSFGYSVAIDGDYIILGNPGDDDNGNYSGSAYVYKREGKNWIHQVKLIPSDATAYEHFGRSVAIDGEYTLIGNPEDSDNGIDSGSVYVFKRSGLTWNQQAKLLPSDGDDYDRFGMSVAIKGEYAIVGATDDDENGFHSGSAYIFKRSGTTWVQQDKLLPSDENVVAFGYSVSIDGDNAVVGTPYTHDNGVMSGCAYVFKRSGTNWSLLTKLLPLDGAAYKFFGWSLAIDGEYVIIGAPYDNKNGRRVGAAYVFKRFGTNWNQQAKLRPSDLSYNDQFGNSVAIDGDNALIGSPHDDDKAEDSGAVYVFKRIGVEWGLHAKLRPSDGIKNKWFGEVVSIDGDYAIIGTLDDIGSNPTYAYIFTRSKIEISDISCRFGRVNVVIKNNGDASENVHWSIDLMPEFGIVLFGNHSKGMIEIQSEKTKSIRSKFAFGIGKISIIVTVKLESEKLSGFIFGPFIFNQK